MSVLLALVVVLVAAGCTPPHTGGGGSKPPVAVPNTAGSFGPAPFSVNFDSYDSRDPDGRIVSYAWDFGDGTTSTEANPTKTYVDVGTYSVTLTVTDDDHLSTTSAPFTVTAHTPGDPSALVLFPSLSRSVGLGEDRIAVWSCYVDGGTGTVPDPVAVAAWAQNAADDYYGFVSRGRYHPVFTGVGTFHVTNGDECLSGAEDRTNSPFTNSMVVDNTTVGGGLGGPGAVYANGTGSAPSEPPSVSHRGFWMGGQSYSQFPNPRILLHEIGHTLHWPHSFLTPTDQYDNPVDLMSAWTGPYSCSVPGWTYQCEPQHTLAFNRWATGWVDPAQVVVHNGGTRQLELDRPGSDGIQLVAAPSTTSSQAVLTVEARPKVNFDEILDVGGVAVHVVDQRGTVCSVGDTFGGCPSLWRRQGQAWGAPDTYDHVLMPGQSHTAYGVTITVDAAVTDGYLVTVSGSAQIPAGTLQTQAPTLRRGPDVVRERPDGGIETVLASP